MPFLIASTVLCVALTLLLARVGYWGTILAFVLGINGYPVGTDDMPADVAVLKQYAIVDNPK